VSEQQFLLLLSLSVAFSTFMFLVGHPACKSTALKSSGISREILAEALANPD